MDGIVGRLKLFGVKGSKGRGKQTLGQAVRPMEAVTAAVLVYVRFGE